MSQELEAPGFVYFIQSGDCGPIKIGFTANPATRFEQLQTASSAPLRMLECVDGTRCLESDLHEVFAGDRVRGEWFRPDSGLLDLINSDVIKNNSITRRFENGNSIASGR